MTIKGHSTYQSQKKCDEMRDWIREQIMSGELVYGQPVPTKNELAKRFKVNKREIDTGLVFGKLIRECLIEVRNVKGQGTQRIVTYHNNTHINIYHKCKKKARYPSERWAKGVATRCSRERKITLNTYHCLLCDGWHITSKNYGKHKDLTTEEAEA